MSKATPPALACAAALLVLAACSELDPIGPQNPPWPVAGQVALLSVSSAFCAEVQISSHPAQERDPDISGSVIVWYNSSEDGSVTNSDVFAYDLVTGQQTQLTVDPADQHSPAVDGRTIIWGNNFFGEPISAYDLDTGVETPSIDGTSDAWAWAISGSVVVWIAFDRVMARDLETGEEWTITDGSSSPSSPAISGHTVVWEDFRTDNTDIYAYDLTTRQERQITTDPAHQRDPAIDGDVIVWEDERNDDGSGTNVDIYGIDLASGQPEEPISTQPGNQTRPDISGDLVVWQDDRNGNLDIYAFDRSTGVETQVTHDAADQQNPVVSGAVIVWEDWRNDNGSFLNSDIYTFVCNATPVDPVEALGELIEDVAALGPYGDGTLNMGQTKGLVRKLEQARELLDKDKAGEAVLVLQGFRQQLFDLETDGVLSAAQRAALVTAVDSILAALDTA